MAAVLEAVTPLASLLTQAVDLDAVTQAAAAAIHAGDARALVDAISSAVTDGDLTKPTLEHAGALTATGGLTADAAVRLGQAVALLEVAETSWSAPWAPAWELVLTIPGFLRKAFDGAVADAGRPIACETGQALIATAAAARRRLIIASPFLHTGFVQSLAPAVERVLATGDEVLVITRALSWAHPERSSANVEAVTVLREAATRAGRGVLTVRSWEESRLGLHFKVVAADEQLAYLGSANLTPGGAAVHAEAGALLRGAGVRTLVTWLDRVADELAARRLPSA